MNTQSIRDYSDSRPLAVGNVFVGRVYRWMGIGLGVTAMVALWVAHTPALIDLIFGNSFILIALIIAQLGMVIAISAVATRANPLVTTGLFLGYAALLGLTLSSILLVYTQSSIAATFFVTGGMFGATSLYGWTTKKDLTSVGSLCFMALIGLILASVVNIFLASSVLGWLISYAGIAIFVGLTAWDTQKIKIIGEQVDPESAQGRGLAIRGALALYLDFVNLFLFVLRIFGRRR